MASQASGAILFGFAALFSCLYLLEEAATTQTQTLASHGRFAWIAAAALLPAVVTTFGLTQLLLFSHVRAGGAAGEGAGRRFLAKATLLAATAALLAGAVTCLVASGYLGDDVGWPHRKK